MAKHPQMQTREAKKKMHSGSLKENDGNPAEHSGKAMKQKQHVYFLPQACVENPLTQQCLVSVKGPSAIFTLSDSTGNCMLFISVPTLLPFHPASIALVWIVLHDDYDDDYDEDDDGGVPHA